MQPANRRKTHAAAAARAAPSSLVQRALSSTAGAGPFLTVWAFGSILDWVRWNRLNKFLRTLYVRKKRSLRFRLHLVCLRMAWKEIVVQVTRFLDTAPGPRDGTVDVCYVCNRVTVYKARRPCVVCGLYLDRVVTSITSAGVHEFVVVFKKLELLPWRK